MKILENKSISHVKGFKAAGLYCGVKASKKTDLALIYSSVPAVGAAAFTTNVVKAAPVLINMEHIQSENIQAIITNSGVANACTGDTGYENAVQMAKTTAEHLNIKPNEVLVSSTGVIGVQLPMDKITTGIAHAAKNLITAGDDGAAEAIMTTDTRPKKITIEIELSGKPVMISGIAKGSGMIHPNMATMLAYVVTDASISKALLDKALKESVPATYNMISVDGDTSTNDTVIALANGAAGNPTIDSDSEEFEKFKNALNFVNESLSKMIAKDGEGATKLLEVQLFGAKSLEDARLCAKSIISSSLVKSAFFGADANWGRILCAMGYSGGKFSPEKVDLSFQNKVGKIDLLADGEIVSFDEDFAYKILSEDFIEILVNLHDGDYSAKSWGCDLTYDYVKINGDYRT